MQAQPQSNKPFLWITIMSSESTFSPFHKINGTACAYRKAERRLAIRRPPGRQMCLGSAEWDWFFRQLNMRWDELEKSTKDELKSVCTIKKEEKWKLMVITSSTLSHMEGQKTDLFEVTDKALLSSLSHSHPNITFNIISPCHKHTFSHKHTVFFLPLSLSLGLTGLADVSRPSRWVLVRAGRGLLSLLTRPDSAMSTPLSSLSVCPLSESWDNAPPTADGESSHCIIISLKEQYNQ